MNGDTCKAALTELGIPRSGVSSSSTNVCYKDYMGNGYNNGQNGGGATYVCKLSSKYLFMIKT